MKLATVLLSSIAFMAAAVADPIELAGMMTGPVETTDVTNARVSRLEFSMTPTFSAEGATDFMEIRLETTPGQAVYLNPTDFSDFGIVIQYNAPADSGLSFVGANPTITFLNLAGTAPTYQFTNNEFSDELFLEVAFNMAAGQTSSFTGIVLQWDITGGGEPINFTFASAGLTAYTAFPTNNTPTMALDAVPEPTTITIVALGLGALALRRRRA